MLTRSYTLEQAQARVRYWQGVLRLMDWQVDVQFKRAVDMHLPSAAAQIWIANTRREAELSILPPEDFKASATARDRDMEDSIVHELLHLHFYDCLHTGDPVAFHIHLAEERAVDALAASLVLLNDAAHPQKRR